MNPVAMMVQRVHQLGQPGLVLTDHGNMAGAVQLYKECSKVGIKPYPGMEGYLIDPRYDGTLEDSGKAGRFHFGVMALTEDGYKGLVKFTSLTHTRPRFSRFARAQLSDLAQLGREYGDGLALTTGCFFGLTQQTLVNEGYDAAKRTVEMYAEWFPNTFVELHQHNIDHIAYDEEGDEKEDLEYSSDLQVMNALYNIAQEVGLPVVAGQDSHYVHQAEQRAHDLMKNLTYGGRDDSFPGDTFHLASSDWMEEHFPDKVWAAVENGHEELLDLWDLHIKPLDTYRIDVPHVTKKPEKKFVKRLNDWLLSFTDGMSASKAKKYHDQMVFEVDVISDLGMESYFMIWDTFVQWCRDQNIAIEARGSANGSLACFALGITQTDPIKWGCDFERFLSRDRRKPPDVDMDIESSRRDEALVKINELFDSVQIGTWSKLGTYIDKQTNEEKGSVLGTWQQAMRRKCEADAWAYEQENPSGKNDKPVKGAAVAAGKKTFARRYGWVKTMDDVKRAAPEHYVGLKRLAAMDSVYRSYGVHASGVLLSGDHVKIDEYIPTMLVASSNTTVTQFSQDDVEEFGLLKMDLLGQETLGVMRYCQELIGRDDPTDFTWIPEDDKNALALLRTGKTDTGIFHFEGYTKAKGGRELGVRSLKDAILVQALYMPGCMDVAPGQKVSQKDLYLRRRKNQHERESVEYLHEAFEKALSETYGAVVFQEQVINIMRNLGMDIEGINKFFKVVKDSGKGAVERNKERMAEVRTEFDGLCEKAGIDPDEAWGQTAAFVAYGFNRNHATGYGIRSYRCAYLKAHYPVEFMTSLLRAWGGRDKEKVYQREARAMDLRLLPPDVNVSDESWTKDGNRIRRGLLSITGIGPAIALNIKKHAPYRSIEHLCKRTGISGSKDFLAEGVYKGAVLHLENAGALKNIEEWDE